MMFGNRELEQQFIKEAQKYDLININNQSYLLLTFFFL